jgi:hypothetical protein
MPVFLPAGEQISFQLLSFGYVTGNGQEDKFTANPEVFHIYLNLHS